MKHNPSPMSIAKLSRAFEYFTTLHEMHGTPIWYEDHYCDHYGLITN